jgi:hypothetical protein
MHNGDDKTTIKIKMVMHTPIAIFVIFWMLGATLALTAAITDMIEQRKFIPESLIVLGLLLSGFGLCLVGFKYESSKSKKILADILN